MALNQADIDTIIALWKYSDQQYDPRPEEKEIKSGLRQTPLVACQYWIKGLSPICSNWTGDVCSYTGEKRPSGYNNGNCDYLGRRSFCDKYKASTEENLKEYKCILPNIFLSGIGKASGDATVGITLTAIPKEDIKGYCNGDCDGAGRGTGCAGTPGISPIICTFFRPWQMGFGSLQPRDLKRTIKKDGSVYVSPKALQEAHDAVSVSMKYRVPLAFVIYNLRAQFQKCAYWDNDYGSYFYIDDDSGYIYSDEDLESKCTCPDEIAKQYCTLKNPTGNGAQDWLLQDVWSQANTIICNGAKPECPKYTGKWRYCDDNHMFMGALVTANQALELRFWANDWANQEEYESIFTERPNWQDVATADIQTFTKWHKLSSTAVDSIAEGQIIHMNVCAGKSGGEPGESFDKVFDPTSVLTKTSIQYTAVGVNAGTTAPPEGQVYFPTLIRDFDKSFSDDRLGGNRLTIIYPYSYYNPWSEESRPEDSAIFCYKYGSAIPHDTVSVVGYTVRNRAVYIFNADMIDDKCSPPSELFTYSSVANISTVKTADNEDDNFMGLSPREIFMIKLKAFIYQVTKYDSDNVISEDSDNYGYFKLGPLKLKYNQLNKIVICVAFADDDWDFRIRPVISDWCGGFLVQESFTQAGTGEDVLSNFTPPAKITAATYPLSTSQVNTNLDSIVHVASNEWTDENFNYHYTYSYCYKKYTVEDSVRQWKSIGSGGMVWAEIESGNINYLFEWGITEARMFYLPSEDKPEEIWIDMENVVIETFVSGKRSVPPAVCIFKIKSGSGLLEEYVYFTHDEWRLEIKYWYKEFSTDAVIPGPNENFQISWPDFDNPNVSFEESTLDISVSQDKITIENVNDQTISLMALFNAPDGRVIASMATKLLVQVVMVECRNVEIDYRYSQPTQWYKLLPETNMSRLATPPTSDECQGEYSPRYYRPPCGDHKNGDQCLAVTKLPGPMWYPFITCEDNDFYREHSGAAYCTNYFPGCPRDDIRFCGPIKYTAFVAGGGGSAYADCVLPFHYRYSVTTGEPTFAGKANIVAYVNMLEYLLYCWQLPTFGNKGREMVTKWISQDRWAYLSYKNPSLPGVKNQWIPLVPDLPDFFMTFNAFDQQSVTGLNNFTHVNQLTFFTCGSLNDVASSADVDDDRKRFEDVFGYRGIWRANYPPPIVYQGLLSHTLHYYFKDPEVTWVWRELWKDIEGGEFVFVSYDEPEYKYDWKKLEHRYICEEGLHNIMYTAPVVDDEAKLTMWPSLSLEGGRPRFFKCLYDGGYEGDVEWMDEGSGEVGGSVSISNDPDKPKNIYEVTSPIIGASKWNHDPNTLFDMDAVYSYKDAEDAGRKYEISDGSGGFIDYYYNRGVIFNLRKESLQYMPYEERDYEFFPGDRTGSSWLGKWFNTSPHFIYDISELQLMAENYNEPPIKICVSEVQVKGQWGFCGEGCSVCLPGVYILETHGKYVEGESEYDVVRTLVSKPNIPYEISVYENEAGGTSGIIRDFVLTFKLQPTPERIYGDLGFKLQISFACANQQWIYLDSITFKVANYVDDSTLISTYERKYISSKSENLGDHNIDGPRVGANFVLQTALDYDYAGTYYAIDAETKYVPEGPITAMDKMRAIYAGKQHRFDEVLDINISNIETIEQTVQPELYNTALGYDGDGDTVIYHFIMPPVYEKFFKNIGFLANISALPFVVETVKPSWEDNHWHGKYKSGKGIWIPEGHRFIWSADIRTMFCYENDYMPEYDVSGYGRFKIMDVNYLHVDTATIEIPVDPGTALRTNRMAYQIEVCKKLFGDQFGFNRVGPTLGTASTFTDTSNVDVY